MIKKIAFMLRTACFGLAAAASVASAAPLTALGYFNYLDTWGDNPMGVTPGMYGNVGGFFSPAEGTTVVGETVPAYGPFAGQTLSRQLVSRASPGSPYEFGLFAPLPTVVNNGLAGEWKLTASNPTTSNSSATVTTLPATVTPLNAPPGIANVQTNGLSSTPTLTWTQANYTPPAGLTRTLQVIVWDASLPVNNAIVHVANLAPQTTSYSVPNTLSGGGSMIAGHNYVISVETVLRNQSDAGTHPMMPLGSMAAKTRSFFNFTPSSNPQQFSSPINLPVETQKGVYTFKMDVQQGVPYLLDPLIAIGYDFTVGTGDSLFASVLLPDLGNFIYDIYLWSGSQWVLEDSVAALTRFDFDGGGVDRFRILGIDPALGLNPFSPTAFVTELTFAGSGRFTGTMKAITAEIPEPETLLLMCIGLMGLLAQYKQRNARATWD